MAKCWQAAHRSCHQTYPTTEDGPGITYAKRYGLQAAFGLPSEDDDGNKAAEPKAYKEPMPHNTPKDEPEY